MTSDITLEEKLNNLEYEIAEKDQQIRNLKRSLYKKQLIKSDIRNVGYITKLNKVEKEILKLYYVENKSQRKIAEELNKSKTSINYHIQKLKKLILY